MKEQPTQQNVQQQNEAQVDTETWGSFHCTKKKSGKVCDLCNHMQEKTTIESIHFNLKLKIHGHLAHDKAPIGKVRWFIYSICDLPCNKIIVGSTQDPKL